MIICPDSAKSGVIAITWSPSMTIKMAATFKTLHSGQKETDHFPSLNSLTTLNDYIVDTGLKNKLI